MMAGAYDIATEHAILAEASAAGSLRAIPAALLFGVFLGALYDLFCMISAMTGVREDPGSGCGRLQPWLLRLRQYRCRALFVRGQTLSDGQETASRKPRRIPAQVLQVMLDLLYFLICGVLGAVFLYWRNDGIMRWYLVLCGGIGFWGYSRSIGRVVLPVFMLCTAALRAGLCALYNGILYPPLHLACRILTVLGTQCVTACRVALQRIQSRRCRKRIRRILWELPRTRKKGRRHRQEVKE